MFYQNVKATTLFLRLVKVKVNNATVYETLNNHLDWPSLLCASDSLNKWNIPNDGGKIDQLSISFRVYIQTKQTL